MALRVVGLGGSLRAGSTSRAALRTALEGAASAGAKTHLLDLRELDLPLYNPENDEPTAQAARVIESCYAAEALIWTQCAPCVGGRCRMSYRSQLPHGSSIARARFGTRQSSSPRPVPNTRGCRQRDHECRSFPATFGAVGYSHTVEPLRLREVLRRLGEGANLREVLDLSPTRPASPSLNERGSLVLKTGDLQAFKPSPGLEPGTASLPWRFRPGAISSGKRAW